MNPGLPRRAVLMGGASLPLLGGCAGTHLFTYRKLSVPAPFAMPDIQVPDFSGAKHFPIADYGASQDDRVATSAAIAQAIDAAHAAGLGVVVVPPGVWPTGKVHLKSNVNLYVSSGATLLFSERPEDYLPAVHSSWEGLECMNWSPLIYAYQCENVALSGGGRIKAKLDVWRNWYARPKAHTDALVALYDMARNDVPTEQRDMTRGEAHFRPQFVQFNRCRNVLIEDISIEDSPFWCIHPYLCRDMVIRRVNIRAHGHNNDGIDPEMTQNLLIEGCIFDQGDDAIALKAGREFDAWRLDTPTRNVVIRNCRVHNGHTIVAIGSEMAGGVENVFIHDCRYRPLANKEAHGGNWVVPMQNVLFLKANERRGGFIRNIHMMNVRAPKVSDAVVGIDTGVLYQWKKLTPTYVRRLTQIEGIRVTHVAVGVAKHVCRIKGEAELPVVNVALRDVKVARVLATPFMTENVKDFRVGD
jgi:polygalacturonase